jgi:hypothetical protein
VAARSPLGSPKWIAARHQAIRKYEIRL